MFANPKNWEIIVASYMNLEQAEEVLNKNLNSKNNLELDIYKAVHFTFDQHGDDDVHFGEARKPLIPVNIGMKLYRQVRTKAVMTTIGAYFEVTDKAGNEHLCAFTNCEGADLDSKCYIQINGELHLLGQPLMTINRVFQIDKASGSQPIKAYFDGMLVKVDATKYQPNNLITNNTDNSEYQLKLPDAPLHLFIRNKQIKSPAVMKIAESINCSPDGYIKSINKEFKIEHLNLEVTNAISLIRESGKTRKISKHGDCGTLIGNVTEPGYITVYGSIFGAGASIIEGRNGTETREFYSSLSHV